MDGINPSGFQPKCNISYHIKAELLKDHIPSSQVLVGRY